MKKYFLFTAALCAAMLSADDARIRAVYTVPGELDDISSQVRGAACSTQGVYLSHMRGIYKIGWNGRLIRKCQTPDHLGDLACHNGRIYGAFPLREHVKGMKGMIRVWDEDLNVVGEHLLPESIKGCAVIGDTIYYGLVPDKHTQDRRCKIGRLSLDFKDLGVRDTDAGSLNFNGIQTMATDGQNLFCGYHGFVTCASFSPDLRICISTPFLDCAHGFAMIPKEIFRSDHPRFLTVRSMGGDYDKWHSITNPVQVRLDFHEYRNGRFFDVTERMPPPYVSRKDFCASDPFVYVDKPEKLYRLYLQSYNETTKCAGVQMRTSSDLISWSVAKEVLSVPKKRKCEFVIAPEMHGYKGKFYMFVTTATKDGTSRNMWIYRADSPEGPFREWSDDAVSPPGWIVADGTLWVEKGRLFMVFCHEMAQGRGGRMMAMEMSPDLKRVIGEPFELFRASHMVGGPWLYRSRNDSLLMLWTSKHENKCCVQVTKSLNGKLEGLWGEHTRILEADGSHAMLFDTRHHQLTMCLHQPNEPREKRRMRLLRMEDLGDTLKVAE